MKKPKLIYGDDNGECTLYDFSLADYEKLREKINLAWENDDDEYAEELEEEMESHKIQHDFYEHGYVPDYVVYMAKVYKIDVDSN